MDNNTLFKCLNGVTAPVARPEYRYPIGRWTEHLDPGMLTPCQVGYHLAKGPRVLTYLRSDLYTAEPCPDHGVLETTSNVITCQVRLTRVDTWNERTARLFAADCAEAALLTEQASGLEPDERSWSAIEAARLYAAGAIDDTVLNAAWDAAWDAAYIPGATSASRGAAAAAASFDITRDAARVTNWAVTSAAAVVSAGSDDLWESASAAASAALYDLLVVYLTGGELPAVKPLCQEESHG